MNYDKERLNKLIDDIKNLVEQNETEDGGFLFDVMRAIVALDFAKTEIEKTIQK